MRHSDLPSAAGFEDFQHLPPHSSQEMGRFDKGLHTSCKRYEVLPGATPYPWVTHTDA